MEQIRDHLRKLGVFKSMGPDGIHPRVPREMAGVVAELLSIIFEKLWLLGEVPGDWKKGNITPILKKGRKEDLGKLQDSEPHLCAWEDHGADPPGRHVKAYTR